jgi:hypothetical protein
VIVPFEEITTAKLIALWNVRAYGGEVFPWPVRQSGRFVDALEAWLDWLVRENRAGTYVSGDGKESGLYLNVAAPTEHAVVEQLEEVVHHHGIRMFPGEPAPPFGWSGFHPLDAEVERQFTLAVERPEWDVTIPLPQLPWTGRIARFPGVVAAQASVYSERGVGPGRSLAVPAVRRLTALLVGGDPAPFQRPTGDGRAIGIQADSESVTFRLAPAQAILSGLFDRPDWSISQSDDGRFTTQLVEVMGGADSPAATQPAVRTVLHTLSSSVRARPLAALLQLAERDRGRWPELLSQNTPHDYARSVVYWLLGRKMLRPVLPVRCPQCATEVDMPPDDLATDLQCEFCGDRFPLGVALATTGHRVSWLYRLPINIPPQRLRSALPVMASLTVLKSIPGLAGPAMPHVLGLNLQAGNWKCEIDLAAVLTDGPRTIVMLGEMKGGRDDIDDNDLDNLVQAQMALRDRGIETVILAATLRDRFSAQEVGSLRRVCEHSVLSLHPFAVEAVLPLVLTAPDLSAPYLSPDHPWRWGGPGGRQSLAIDTAMESCRRNLGLLSVGFQQVDGQLRPSVVWNAADDKPAPEAGIEVAGE